MDSLFTRLCGSTPVIPPSLSIEERLNPAREISRVEQIHRFANGAYTLYWQAERTRKLGISWRNFCVGCAMWAFREDASSVEQRWACFCGMNTKIRQDSRNICAEPVPLNIAYSKCYTEIIGMVIVGVPREEDTSPTLRPCEHCRVLMKHHPLVTPDTIVVTALPPQGSEQSFDDIRYELFSFESLLKEYGEF